MTKAEGRIDPQAEGTLSRWTLVFDILPLIIGTLPYLALFIASVAHWGDAGSPGTDFATIELRTRNALHFHELLGPYSRYFWSHPGPISFYWMAPFYALSGHHFGGLGAASAAANLGWIAGIIWAARCAGGRIAAWLAVLPALGFVYVFGYAWLNDPWNPMLIILSVAAVAVFGAATWAGVRWALPATALAATWSIQTHIGTTGVVAVVLCCTILPALWTHRRDGARWIVSIVGTVLGTLFLWTPPLIEQFARPPGNLREIYRFFQTTNSSIHSFWTVGHIIAPQATLSITHLGQHVVQDNGYFGHFHGRGMALVAVLLVVIVLGVFRGFRERKYLQLGCCLSALTGPIVAVFSARAAAGPLMAYFTLYATGLGIVVWFAALLSVWDLVSLITRSISTKTWHKRVAPVLGALSAVLLAGVSIWLAIGCVRLRPLAARISDADVTRLTNDVRATLGPKPQGPVLVVVGGNRPWGKAVGIAAMLERSGITARTSQPWVFLFGYESRARGDERAGFLVVGADKDHVFPPPPIGGTLIGQSGDTQVWKLSPNAAAIQTVIPTIPCVNHCGS